MKEILLSKGEKVIVDDEDFDELNQFKWYLSKYGYAVRNSKLNNKRIKIYMHKYINSNHEFIDHINGNKLDNRRCNLRGCTLKQNSFNQKISKNNKSGYKGVYFSKKANKWIANINKDYKRIHLGTFLTAKEAAKAYNKAAIELYGKFARLNNV